MAWKFRIAYALLIRRTMYSLELCFTVNVSLIIMPVYITKGKGGQMMFLFLYPR